MESHRRLEAELFGIPHCVSAHTTAGMRDENQDSLVAVVRASGRTTVIGPGSVREMDGDGPDMVLVAVCDGLGGLPDGAEAATLVSEKLGEWACGRIPEGHDGAVLELRRRIAGIEEELLSAYPLGCTTLSAVIGTDGRWTSLHLGDSRCYSVYPDRVERTRDHSPVEELFRSGRITEDGMNSHPQSNIMDRCMGNGDAGSLEVRPVADGWTRLALCTDGAFGYMPVSGFHGLLRTASGASEIAEGAYREGSTDNITVLTIDRRLR